MAAQGKTYQDSLPAPTVATEQSRLDLQHRAFILSIPGLHLAKLPTPPPRLVLDLGTGSGIWAVEYATAHPESIVVGADIAPPTHHTSLPNLAWVTADATKDWSPIIATARSLLGVNDSTDIKFDYVNVRLLTYAMRTTTWGPFFKFVSGHMSSGALLEVADVCRPRGSKAGYDSATSALFKLMEVVTDASESAGVEMQADKNHAARLEEAGLEVVQKQLVEWRTGEWGEGKDQREIGKIMGENANALLKGAAERARKMGAKGEEEEQGGWEGLAERARAENVEELQLFTMTVIFVARKL